MSEGDKTRKKRLKWRGGREREDVKITVKKKERGEEAGCGEK